MFAVLGALVQILLGLAVLLVIAAIAFPKFVIAIIAYPLATAHILVRKVEENTGMWIMKGGRAWRFITPDRTTDPVPDADPVKNWLLPEIPRSADSKLINATGGAEHWIIDRIDEILPGGIRWVGARFLGYQIFKYHFRWSVLRDSKPVTEGSNKEEWISEVRPIEGTSKWVVSFSQTLDYIYLRDAAYYFEVFGAETKSIAKDPNDPDKSATVGMPLKIHAVPTVRVMNPYHTLFVVHDWLQTTLNLLEPAVRYWVAMKTYDEVIGKREVAEHEYDELLRQSNVPDDLWKAVFPTKGEREKNPKKSIADYLETTYGIREKRVAFQQIAPPQEYTRAVIKRAEAEQNKNATITNAEADAKRKEILGKGEAAGLEAVMVTIQRFGADALRVRELEAIESIGADHNMVVVGSGNPNLLLSPQQPRLVTPTRERTEKKEGEKA